MADCEPRRLLPFMAVGLGPVQGRSARCSFLREEGRGATETACGDSHPFQVVGYKRPGWARSAAWKEDIAGGQTDRPPLQVRQRHGSLE